MDYAVLSTFRNISPETRSVLKEMDALTLIALKTFPPSLIKSNLNPSTSKDIVTEEIDLGWKKIGKEFHGWKKKKNDVKLLKRNVSEKFSTYVLNEDDLFGSYSCIDNLTNKGLSSTLLFPMKDKIELPISMEQAQYVAEDLDLVEGRALPTSYNSDFDMLSDESFSRTFFYSMFATLIARQKPNDPSIRSDLGPFVVDMAMQHLKVRKSYRPYGARVHFDQDQQVTAIFDYFEDRLVKPGDGRWAEAKLLTKVTAFTLVTAREHLVWSHLVLSNTVARESTLELAPSHPIRRLLTIFTFRTNEVNLRAFGTLVPKTAILHRALGLEFESLQEVFDMAYEQCDIYKPFPDHTLAPEIEKLCKEDKFPYITQGRTYWNIVHKFVSNWITESGDAAHDAQAMSFYEKLRVSSEGQAYEIPQHTSDNEMINLITQIIFTVTAYHELVGNVTDYLKLPTRAGFRLLEDHRGTSIDIQSWLLGCLIGASTSIRMPQMMRPYDNFFGSDGAPVWERSIWNGFIGDLDQQSEKVKEADTKRGVEFKYFDPERFECSISV